MSLFVPNRKQNFSRSNHVREPRQSRHTSKRLQRNIKHIKLSGIDYFEAVAQDPADVPPPPDGVGEYKCDYCQEDFLINHDLISCCQDGIATCAAHFLCNACISAVFKQALTPGWRYFPARCCPSQDSRRGIDIDCCLSALYSDNWGRDKIRAYKSKAEEYSVMTLTPDLYVHCAKCGIWLHPCCIKDLGISAISKYQVAICRPCGTKTCMECKSEWEGFFHRCNGSEDPSVKPDWLPDYAPDCRIKPCPRCRTWIQLYDACNHMTCENCYYQFCFVCMMKWSDVPHGCPLYGDPAGGYDAEGYGLDGWGLHVYTGLDRSGRNRISILEQRGSRQQD
ncbi:hypothetical protein P171DRAFT_495500 [Karstenula rhodostoma CBS 690.94]|uniref:RING-type domain-containing protein n=1 Tax=Karstenula rhodostoma CBS 690.94 TaxID=1392251 RepID=A0A9P4PIU4_9PLEO|nr:hypothetical protein P171DRAFT_495500 [Karstenula rhodostoma CBS 690.94]